MFKINPISAQIGMIKFIPTLIWYYVITYGGLFLINYGVYALCFDYVARNIQDPPLNLLIGGGIFIFFNFVLGLNIALGAFLYKEASYERKLQNLMDCFKQASDIMKTFRYFALLLLLGIVGLVTCVACYFLLGLVLPEMFPLWSDIINQQKPHLYDLIIAEIVLFLCAFLFVSRILLAIPHAIISNDSLFITWKMSKFFAKGNRISFIIANYLSIALFAALAWGAMYLIEPIAREFAYFEKLAELLSNEKVMETLNTEWAAEQDIVLPELEADTIIYWHIFIPIIQIAFFLWTIMGLNTIMYLYYKKALDNLKIQDDELITVDEDESQGGQAKRIEPSVNMNRTEPITGQAKKIVKKKPPLSDEEIFGHMYDDAPQNVDEKNREAVKASPPKEPVSDDEIYNQMYGNPPRKPLSDDEIYNQMYGDSPKNDDN